MGKARRLCAEYLLRAGVTRPEVLAQALKLPPDRMDDILGSPWFQKLGLAALAGRPPRIRPLIQPLTGSSNAGAFTQGR